VGWFSICPNRLSPLTISTVRDKNDEREFTDVRIFTNNGPDWIQRRARAAMFVLNATLLFFVFLTVRKTFQDDAFAIACLAFLVIDPPNAPICQSS